MSLVKNYILDTNVLLHDPNSLLAFKGNNVLIPIEVIEEIDRFKRESSELGQNARTVSRTLDALRAKGHLNKGVKLDNGGMLRIIFHENNGRTARPSATTRWTAASWAWPWPFTKPNPKCPPSW
jgi:PhoH-like ATPase